MVCLYISVMCNIDYIVMCIRFFNFYFVPIVLFTVKCTVYCEINIYIYKYI